MDAVSRRVYEFEGFTIDMMRRTLRTLEQEIELRPRSFDVLCCLVEHAGRLVTKREFFRRVWPGVNVSDESLARCVSDIRLAIGDRQQRMIKTMPGRGYLLAVAAAPLPDGIGEVPAIGETGVALATDPIRGVAAGIDADQPQVWPLKNDEEASRAAPSGIASSTIDAAPVLRVPAPRTTALLAAGCIILMTAVFEVWSMGLLSGSTVLKWIDENNAAGHAFSVPVAVLTFATSRPLSATAPPVAPTIEDEVRGYLSRIPLFRVVSGDGTRHLETDSPNRNVWAKAGLRYAIAGSEHEAGGNLQLSVALIDMSSQLQIWSERFDYALSEWPLRQVEVARRIAYAVHVESIRREGAALNDQIVNLPVSQLLAKGWATLMGWGVLGLGQAERIFSEVLRRDPESTSAMVGLAGSKILAASNLKGDRVREMADAEALLRKAVVAQPNDFIAYFYLGVLHNLEDNVPAALQAYDRALEMNPSFAPAHAYKGRALIRMGRHQEALQSIDYAYHIAGKIVSGWRLWQGIAECQLGQHEAAGVSFRKAVAALPDNPYVHAALASFHALSGEWGSARVHVDQLRKRTSATSDEWRLLEFNRGLDNQPLPGRFGEGLRLALQASPEFH